MGRQQFERLLLKRRNKPQAAQTSFVSATIIEHVAYLVKEIIYPLILKKENFLQITMIFLKREKPIL